MPQSQKPTEPYTPPPVKERVPYKAWRKDFTLEPLRDRIMALLCGGGIMIPVGRGWSEGTWPWQWTGDRIAIIVIFLIIGVLSVTLTSED